MYALVLSACQGALAPSVDGNDARSRQPAAEPFDDPEIASPRWVELDPVVEPVGPLIAEISADVSSGEYPLAVTFDLSASLNGSGWVVRDLSFGDGAELVAEDLLATHTYVGEGSFEATLTLLDEVTGEVASAAVVVDVESPGCPTGDPSVGWGSVDDSDLDELSGLVASRVDPSVWWVHEDSGNTPALVALDTAGATLAWHELPDEFGDFEDLAAAIDPQTGVSTLFLADIGDNGWDRGEIAVWVTPEPDPHADGDVTPLRMALTYPDGARDAETLLVDPLTFDVFVVTKVTSGTPDVYVKRAPHDAEGPFELEAVGEWSTIPLSATGGDVSPDGSRIVVRDYSDTAAVWVRDGYLPLEAAFDAEPCEVEIHGEQQGEAIGFTADGTGVVTVSEGVGQTLYYVDL